MIVLLCVERKHVPVNFRNSTEVNCYNCGKELYANETADKYICLTCAFKLGMMTPERLNELMKMMNSKENN